VAVFVVKDSTGKVIFISPNASFKLREAATDITIDAISVTGQVVRAY
jgi:hypothetical protein